MKKLFLFLFGLLTFISSFTQSVDGALKTLTASGTDTYSISEAFPSNYDSKERFLIRFTNANFGASTLNRNGLGAKSIKKADGSDLSSGDIQAGATYLLSYNGINYQIIGAYSISSTNTTSNIGSGLTLWPTQSLLVTGPTVPTSIYTLTIAPTVSGPTTSSVSVNNTTSLIDVHQFDTELGITSIPSGAWAFNIYASVDNQSNNNYVIAGVFKAVVGSGTATITGTGTTRTVTTTSSMFVSNDYNADITSTSYIRLPDGFFPISSYISATSVNITVPSGYVNTIGVSYRVHRKLFTVSTPDIGSSTGLLYSVSIAEPSFAVNTTDKINILFFGRTDASNSRTITYYQDGNTQNTSIVTPLSINHNILNGLQGGTTNEYYHLTNNTFTGLTTANGFLTGNGSGTISAASGTGYLKFSGITPSYNATIPNADLSNSSINIAGNSTSLGGTITQDQITGLSSTGLIRRTGTNTLAVSTGTYNRVATWTTGNNITAYSGFTYNDTTKVLNIDGYDSNITFSAPMATLNVQDASSALSIKSGVDTFINFGNTSPKVSMPTDVLLGASSSNKLGFYGTTPITKPSGSVPTALLNLGLITSPTITLSSDVTGTLPIANGGTGQTTANAALNALLPSQTGNSNKYLVTDGTNASWQNTTINTYKYYSNEMINSFGSGEFPWSGTTSGGSVVFNGTYGVGSTEYVNGLYEAATSTSSTAVAAFINQMQFTFGNGYKYDLSIRSALSALSDGTDTYISKIGFMDTYTTASPTVDGAYFRYTHGTNSGKWQAVTVSNSTETATDTGITADAGTFHIFRIVPADDASKVEFYIDGTLVATNTTNIINSSARLTSLACSIEKSAGTTSRSLYNDYAEITISRTTAR